MAKLQHSNAFFSERWPSAAPLPPQMIKISHPLSRLGKFLLLFLASLQTLTCCFSSPKKRFLYIFFSSREEALAANALPIHYTKVVSAIVFDVTVIRVIA